MAKTDKTNSSVKIVGGKLILSLPDAMEPVVWQMDLEQAQSAALTVKENKKAKSFSLVLKVQGGKTEEIAPFADKQSAMDVLMETSEVLQNAQENIHKHAPAAVAQTSASKGEKGDKLGAFLAAALVIVLIFSWVMLSSAPEKLANAGRSQNNYAGASATGNPRDSAGVPVSADDFLSNR